MPKRGTRQREAEEVQAAAAVEQKPEQEQQTTQAEQPMQMYECMFFQTLWSLMYFGGVYLLHEIRVKKLINSFQLNLIKHLRESQSPTTYCHTWNMRYKYTNVSVNDPLYTDIQTGIMNLVFWGVIFSIWGQMIFQVPLVPKFKWVITLVTPLYIFFLWHRYLNVSSQVEKTKRFIELPEHHIEGSCIGAIWGEKTRINDCFFEGSTFC